MDSKNLIWLSSFFSLLFITFCVTRHLDDLNPNIVSMPHKSQAIPSELATVHLDNNIQNSFAPKVETPKVETPKVETPKVETPKPRIQTQEHISTPKPKVSPTKKRVLKKPIQKRKSSTIKKVKKQKILISQTKKRYRVKTITKIVLNASHIKPILKGKENNQLNKIAYLHNIQKGRKIMIHTPSMQAGKHLKTYLKKHHVAAHDIMIVKNENENITLTLTGRK